MYLVSGVTVPDDEFAILWSTDQKPEGGGGEKKQQLAEEVHHNTVIINSIL